ncbi:Uncharacterised protein [Moraxella lacunata]|uniref:Uncharacterized protein n=2 Tax=Moraxella lacunata TaxID=477 RepID=A0A378TT09_MORLA|nr:Uncharacterised protein [Moraxella lacunata]
MLKRIPPLERERGRITGSKLKEIDSYIRRDWNDEGYANNHIWVSDDHSSKMLGQAPQIRAGGHA